MAMKRQWHYDNAQQLYNQWSTEMEAVRLCD